MTTGTYAKLHFISASADLLVELCQKARVPHPVPKNKLHVTLLYSRKHLPNYEPDLHGRHIASPLGFDVWKSNGENGAVTNCLVMKLDCSTLVERHLQLMKEHEATFDYPVYEPHVTLSYDIGEYDLEQIVRTKWPSILLLAGERKSDLDLTWTPDK